MIMLWLILIPLNQKSHVIKIKSTDESTLLINFLNELLFLKDKKNDLLKI